MKPRRGELAGIGGVVAGGRALLVGALVFAVVAHSPLAARASVGGITEYVVPTASSQPTGITAGPDGNLWFTENQANKIGRSTPTGSFTEFPVPNAFFDLRSIAAGPDGNLWFPESHANKIERMSTSGVITEFAIPTAASSPAWIAAGPDGNLWFGGRLSGPPEAEAQWVHLLLQSRGTIRTALLTRPARSGLAPKLSGGPRSASAG